MRMRGMVIAAVVAALAAGACSNGSPRREGPSPAHRSAPPSAAPSASAAPPSAAPLPDGVRAMVGTGPYPFGVTVAFDRVWVTAHDGYSVDVIDPVTRQTVRTIGLDVQPGAVVSGGGFVWVQSRSDASLVRIDPATYAVRRVALADSGSTTCSIAFGHGMVWAAVADNSAPRASILQVDPAGATVAGRVPVHGFPCAWAAFGDREWTVTNDGLVSLVPGTTKARTIKVPELRDAGEVWLVGTAHGQLFVTGSDGMLGSRLFRIRPTGTVTAVLRRPTDQLVALHAGEPGLWFASNGTDQVLVVDPTTMRLSGKGTLFTGEVVPDPTMAQEQLWLPDSTDTAVVHVDPSAFLNAPA